MTFTATSEEDLRECRALLRVAECRIETAILQNRKVHIIWDFDRVLIDGRSADAFELIGTDARRFVYEERLLFVPYDDGPWASFAGRVGDFHYSQAIVVHRPEYRCERIKEFLRNNKALSGHRLISVEHAGNRDAAIGMLAYIVADPAAFIVRVSASQKALDAFSFAALFFGVKDRCMSIVSPITRSYDEDELRQEIEQVLRPAIARFEVVINHQSTGMVKRRVTAYVAHPEYTRRVFRTPDPKCRQVAAATSAQTLRVQRDFAALLGSI